MDAVKGRLGQFGFQLAKGLVGDDPLSCRVHRNIIFQTFNVQDILVIYLDKFILGIAFDKNEVVPPEQPAEQSFPVVPGPQVLGPAVLWWRLYKNVRKRLA